MENKIIDFKNIIKELEDKKLSIVFLKNRGMFLQDNDRKLYKFEDHMHGSCLDRLIKKGEKVTFSLIPRKISENIGDWEKEVWGVKEVKEFMERHDLI